MYRLSRIQQLTAVDLSDPEERLRLSLSFFAPEPEEDRYHPRLKCGAP